MEWVRLLFEFTVGSCVNFTISIRGFKIDTRPVLSQRLYFTCKFITPSIKKLQLNANHRYDVVTYLNKFGNYSIVLNTNILLTLPISLKFWNSRLVHQFYSLHLARNMSEVVKI
jgi:hypothetical protein